MSVEESGEGSEEELLFCEIESLLKDSELGAWVRHGRMLNSGDTHPRAKERWEKIFELGVGMERLLLRCSQKVLARPAGSRYILKPVAEPDYSVALCGKDFCLDSVLESPIGYTGRFSNNSQTATDFYREILEGELAKRLFVGFEEHYGCSLREQESCFQNCVAQQLDELEELIRSQGLSELWDIRRDSVGRKVFSTEQNGILIEIVYDTKGQSFLRFSQGNFEKIVKDAKMLGPVFEELSRVERMRGLIEVHQSLSNLHADEAES